MDQRIYIIASLSLIKNGICFRRIFQLPIAKGGTLGGQAPGNGSELQNWIPAMWSSYWLPGLPLSMEKWTNSYRDALNHFHAIVDRNCTSIGIYFAWLSDVVIVAYCPVPRLLGVLSSHAAVAVLSTLLFQLAEAKRVEPICSVLFSLTMVTESQSLIQNCMLTMLTLMSNRNMLVVMKWKNGFKLESHCKSPPITIRTGNYILELVDFVLRLLPLSHR